MVVSDGGQVAARYEVGMGLSEIGGGAPVSVLRVSLPSSRLLVSFLGLLIGKAEPGEVQILFLNQSKYCIESLYAEVLIFN